MVYAYSSQFDFKKCYTVVNCYMLTYLFHNPLQCNQLHQVQSYLFTSSAQVPPFWHGLLAHSSISEYKTYIIVNMVYAYSSQLDFKKCYTIVNCYMLTYLFHNPLQCNQLHKCNHICLHHLHRYHHFDMDCWHIHQYLCIKHILSWILVYAYSSQFDLKNVTR